MPTDERPPFEIRSATWYREPLDYELVIYEANHETHVATVTMNRPEKRNALSHQLRGEIFHALKVAERDNEINAIVLKGAGPCFSAGYDFGGGMGTEEPDFGSQYVGTSHWARYLVNQYWQIWELSKTVIAQTHGFVLAGATELCFVCDLLVTTPDCQFGYPPMRNVAAPDLMWFPWMLPPRIAREMVFTGDSITGEDAHRHGMANYCVPAEDIDEFTDVYARRVALVPWHLATLRKRALQKAYELMGVREALEIAALMQEELNQNEFVKESYAMERKISAGELSMRDYLDIRDGPYRELRAQEAAILARAESKSDESA
jgi:enoyl-CoA hydratase